MSGLSDLLEGWLPDVGNLLKGLDLSGLVGDVTNILGSLDLAELLEKLPLEGVQHLFGGFDPLKYVAKLDLSGLVATVGETALDLLGNVMGPGGSPPKLKLVS